MEPFNAIWDTGATNSVISQAVVDACGLLPTGMATVHHAGGSSQAETYLVNIGLPQMVVFNGVRVTKAELAGGADMLIGMNIINQGDFAVTNRDGKTKFTFRVPSTGDIDFVAEDRAEPQASGNREARRGRLTHPRQRQGRGRRGGYG